MKWVKAQLKLLRKSLKWSVLVVFLLYIACFLLTVGTFGTPGLLYSAGTGIFESAEVYQAQERGEDVVAYLESNEDAVPEEVALNFILRFLSGFVVFIIGSYVLYGITVSLAWNYLSRGQFRVTHFWRIFLNTLLLVAVVALFGVIIFVFLAGLQLLAASGTAYAFLTFLQNVLIAIAAATMLHIMLSVQKFIFKAKTFFGVFSEALTFTKAKWKLLVLPYFLAYALFFFLWWITMQNLALVPNLFGFLILIYTLLPIAWLQQVVHEA